MGDRGLVLLKFDEELGIAIYDHWGGSGAVENAKQAAAVAMARAGDPSYFARIFVDQFTKDGRDQETGFGLYPIKDVEGFDPEQFGGDYPWYVLVDAVTGQVTPVGQMVGQT